MCFIATNLFINWGAWGVVFSEGNKNMNLEYKEPQLMCPQVNVKGCNFGSWRLYNYNDAFSGIYIRDRYCGKFGDFCFGPYVDYDALEDYKIYPIDDFFIAHKPGENEVVLYDQNEIVNKPIDWFDSSSGQQKIVFLPKSTLYAVPKPVAEARYKQPGQTDVETMVFDTIYTMGFDYFLSWTGNRFLRFIPKSGKTDFDSGFLIKTDNKEYSWYKIDSANMQFQISYMKDYVTRSRESLSNFKQLVDALKEDKHRHDLYLQKQYYAR